MLKGRKKSYLGTFQTNLKIKKKNIREIYNFYNGFIWQMIAELSSIEKKMQIEWH